MPHDAGPGGQDINAVAPDKTAGATWLRYTQRMLELHLIEDTHFLMAFGRAAGQGAKHPLEALDRVCAAAIKYWDQRPRERT